MITAMVNRRILMLSVVLLTGCATLSPYVVPLADLAISVAGAYYHLPPTATQAATLAFNDLWGMAAQANANLGKTPAQANIAQGASNPVLGQAVQKALPDAPMTAATVTHLQQAAQDVLAKGKQTH
jgi:hypothetical protein